jgi:hypothetical protein
VYGSACSFSANLTPCIPTGTHGPTCIFWANLTPCSLRQPLLVSLSAFTLATECVCMILKIDDLVPSR